MQHILIRNNGPVKDYEMDVKKYNILIGEQATGKSTIAKSIYYSRYIKTLIANFLVQVMETGTYYGEGVIKDKPFFKYIGHNMKDIFIHLFGYSWDLDANFTIRYTFTESIWLESVIFSNSSSRGKKYITQNYSPVLKEEIMILQEAALAMFEEANKVHLSLEMERETRARNREYILHKVNEVFEDDLTTYYIPAGRSMLTLLSASRATMNSLQNIDFIMNRFLELIDGVRNIYKDGVREAFKYSPKGNRAFDVHAISQQIIDMQKGEYISDPSSEFLRVASGYDKYEDIKINFASSGQQEIVWLLNFLYVLMLRNEKSFVIIEEPEAHIYPSLQKKIIDFIIQFANICDSNVLVTTHSPYVLMTMNNAYYAGCVAENGNETKVSKVVKPPYRIARDSLTAIKLENGKAPSVVDLVGSNDEINSYLIDDISEKINEVYTSIFAIKESEANE